MPMVYGLFEAHATGNKVYYARNNDQNIFSGIHYYDLIISGSSGTKTFNNDLFVDHELKIGENAVLGSGSSVNDAWTLTLLGNIIVNNTGDAFIEIKEKLFLRVIGAKYCKVWNDPIDLI
jgi:hypothetical protein